MSNKTTCGKCTHFISSRFAGKFGDCQVMRNQCQSEGERNTEANSSFWRYELGGKSFAPNVERACTQFEAMK